MERWMWCEGKRRRGKRGENDSKGCTQRDETYEISMNDSS